MKSCLHLSCERMSLSRRCGTSSVGVLHFLHFKIMAYLISPFFFGLLWWLPMSFPTYPFIGDGENGRMAWLPPLFRPLALPPSAISSHSGLEMLMTYPKKIPEVNPYIFTVLIILLLFAATFKVWFRFGPVASLILFSISSGLVQVFFILFSIFPSPLLSQYTLLLAYHRFISEFVLIFVVDSFSFPFFFFLRYTIHLPHLPIPLFYLLISMNSHPFLILHAKNIRKVRSFFPRWGDFLRTDEWMDSHKMEEPYITVIGCSQTLSWV